MMEDMQSILKAQRNWQHPRFMAYYPAAISQEVIVGGLFSSAFNSPNFTWHANPSATEIENLVSDYLVTLMGLP